MSLTKAASKIGPVPKDKILQALETSSPKAWLEPKFTLVSFETNQQNIKLK